jgi:hypothetical protein
MPKGNPSGYGKTKKTSTKNVKRPTMRRTTRKK